jgi:hypothetical protein
MLRSVDAVYSDVLTAEQPAVLSWPVHRTVP